MNQPTKRPVPHIQHSQALEDAAIAVANAKDGRGSPVHLCRQPFDVHAVRATMSEVARWFEDPAFYTEGEEEPAAEIAAVENLILLATLLREHLRAGNLT